VQNKIYIETGRVFSPRRKRIVVRFHYLAMYLKKIRRDKNRVYLAPRVPHDDNVSW